MDRCFFILRYVYFYSPTPLVLSSHPTVLGGADTVRLLMRVIFPHTHAHSAAQTVSSIYSFFLAMTLFPEVMKKAQAEIDAVVGNDRLPDFSDRENLPYIDALSKEVFRWHTVAPTGQHTPLSHANRANPRHVCLKGCHTGPWRMTFRMGTSFLEVP
jgi:hypothetical protein